MNRTLPKWLQENAKVPLPEYKISLRPNYLEKTLQYIESIFAEDLKREAVSDKPGFLQRMEPHCKLCAAFILLFAAAWTRKLEFLIVLNFILFSMAIKVGLGVKAFAVRVWLPAFFFTGFSVLPGIISWVTPGESLYTVYFGVHLELGWFTLPTALYITKQGVHSALFVILRSASSMGLMLLVLNTTRWSIFTKVLARFKLPSIVVAVLDLTYRYIYLFLLLFLEYIMGRRSRLAGREKEKLTWIGRTIADFLRLTEEYAADINYAMQSRGYSGEYHAKAKLAVRFSDIGFLAMAALVCCFA